MEGKHQQRYWRQNV